MRKVAVTGAVVIGAAGAIVVGSAPASAAPKCWEGTWEVVSTSADIKDEGLAFKLKGGEGIKLKLDSKGKASYDFRGSEPLTGKGRSKGLPATATLTLTKRLQMANKVTGSATGKITGNPKTAKGDARITIVGKVGLIKQTFKYAVAREVKRDGDKGVVPRSASYACTAKTLTIKQTIKKKKLRSITVWQLRRA